MIKGITVALQAAAENGHTEVVKLLLAAGADVNWRNHEGVTSLYMAAQNGHDQVGTDLYFISVTYELNAI